MTLAQRVRDHRYTRGWGPDELASRAEISRTALYQIESGKTELPRAGTLRRIAIALDVPMEALLGTDGAGGAPPGTFPTSFGLRRGRAGGEWLPSEGGSLATPAPRGDSSREGGDSFRMAIEPSSQPAPARGQDPSTRSREGELTRKFQEILASPLGEGLARIVEETHRMIPSHGSVG